jgi:hypothetical protein
LTGRVRWFIAAVLFVAILAIGILLTRVMSGGGPAHTRPDEPEDVADLEVFFVCGECGTEFQVTRLGEAQIPRHCGEKMEVVRRSPLS